MDDYQDGRLAPFLHNIVSAHLMGCAECRRDLLEIRSLVEAIRGIPEEPIPPRVLKRIVKSLTEPDNGGSALPEDALGTDLCGGLESL
jgi:anti-sigma factor RsiW